MSLPLIYYFGLTNKKSGIKSLKKEARKSPELLTQKMAVILNEYSIPMAKRIGLMALPSLDTNFPDYELLEDMLKIAENNKYNIQYENNKTQNEYPDGHSNSR